MLDASGLNYWALLVAWVISMILGAYWYSPAGFGKLWSKLSGVDMMKMPKDEANRAISFVALSSLVQVVALGILINSLNATTVGDGLLVGLLVWAGFAAATTVGNNLYSRLSWKFWWLNSSFYLIILAVNGIILAAWR